MPKEMQRERPKEISDDIINEIQCERCGRCLTVCPVYQQTRIETFSPRGRLELIRAVSTGELTPGDRYRQSIQSCLQCLACLNACPKGVEAANIIRKEKSSDQYPGIGHKTEALLLKLALGKPFLLAKAAFFAGFLQNHIKANSPKENRTRKSGQISRHLPLFFPGILAGRRIPDIRSQNNRTQYPETIPPPAHIPITGEIILFTGCFFGFLDTRPLNAAIRVLGENGIKIHIPKNQVCCGAPADLAGHPAILKQGCTQNLFALKGRLPVITLCATCGNALKNEYPRIFKQEVKFKEIARELGRRILDINEFLVQLDGFTPGPHPINKRVTLHMPCHLAQGMKAGESVSTLLKRLPLNLVKMEGTENCCGGGGLCALHNPDLSKQLGNLKARNIVNSGAQILTAPCPGCLTQIKDQLGANNAQIESIHPIELVARTYAKDDQ